MSRPAAHPSSARRPAGVIGAEPLHLPPAHMQSQGHLRSADLSGRDGPEQTRPRHFLAAHREYLPWVHGVTFSLSS